ncbi:hypothetical protein BELL_0114g00280 [Botrytis elliptica]|uniref:Cytochrome P450 n=1 Tax=Botrytis elliptica TaxID=278938 RepID=A0A4Z1JTY4_9HELO|nr:hypothetical protein BELL_0114g00280 [Botrytis elliptica]
MYRINAAPAKICNDLARRYGDLATLWLGSCPVIMINTPQAAHCLLQRKAASTSSRPMHNNFRHKIMPFRVVLEPEGETFRKLRQIYNKFLGKQHLQIFQKNQEEESESAYETVEWTKFLPNFS